MAAIKIGSKVTVNKNLKSGRVVGIGRQHDNTIYYVRFTDLMIKKIIGDFVYTEKQLTVTR